MRQRARTHIFILGAPRDEVLAVYAGRAGGLALHSDVAEGHYPIRRVGTAWEYLFIHNIRDEKLLAVLAGHNLGARHTRFEDRLREFVRVRGCIIDKAAFKCLPREYRFLDGVAVVRRAPLIVLGVHRP